MVVKCCLSHLILESLIIFFYVKDVAFVSVKFHLVGLGLLVESIWSSKNLLNEWQMPLELALKVLSMDCQPLSA